MSLKGKLRVGEGFLIFWCPGCKEAHGVTSAWSFNGNYDNPTLSPSILIASGHYCHLYEAGNPCWCTYNKEHLDNPAPFKCDVCHSFLRDGRIEFLSDCTHELAGKIVDLEVFPS